MQKWSWIPAFIELQELKKLLCCRENLCLCPGYTGLITRAGITTRKSTEVTIRIKEPVTIRNQSQNWSRAGWLPGLCLPSPQGIVLPPQCAGLSSLQRMKSRHLLYHTGCMVCVLCFVCGVCGVCGILCLWCFVFVVFYVLWLVTWCLMVDDVWCVSLKVWVKCMPCVLTL